MCLKRRKLSELFKIGIRNWMGVIWFTSTNTWNDQIDNKIYAESDNALQYLFKLVDKLPPKSALVINLFYVDNLSLSEISQILGLSLTNTKVILHRSRNTLRDLLLKHTYQEELLWKKI